MEELESPQAPSDVPTETAAPENVEQPLPPADPQPEDVEQPPSPVDPKPQEVGQAVSPANPPLEAEPTVTVDEIMGITEAAPETVQPASVADAQLRAVLEAVVYVAEEPLTLAQLAAALQQPPERIRTLLEQLIAEFDRPEHGVTIREVAGGYKMATKPEHHEAVRTFVKSLKPPLKLSLPALETLAVIAYKQPVTAPEIMEIRGVQGAGVLKTLLDRKLIAVAGRKNVIGKPILYKSTKEFLIQFGLKDLAELPSLKEFEEIRRMAFADSDIPAPEAPAETELPETVTAEAPVETPAESAAAPELPEAEAPPAAPVEEEQ
jgi:segregation and condensation protein B